MTQRPSPVEGLLHERRQQQQAGRGSQGASALRRPPEPLARCRTP